MENDIKKNRIKKLKALCSNIGLGFFAYEGVSHLMYTLVSIIISFVFVLFNKDSAVVLKSEWFSWVSMIVLDYGFGLIIMAAILKRTNKSRVIYPKRSLHKKSYIALGLVCMAVMYLGSFVSSGLSGIIERLFGVVPNDTTSFVKDMNIVWMIVMVVILGPIVEEIMFRKFIIDRLRSYGELFSIIASSLLFALLHGNIYQVFYAFGFGAVLGLVYVKTNNIKVTIAYHMIFNFLGSVVPVGLMRFGEANEQAGLVVAALYSLLVIFAIVSGVFLCITYLKKVKLKKSECDILTGGDKACAFSFNPGMILAFFMIAYKFVAFF